jgi:hypothetical protein
MGRIDKAVLVTVVACATLLWARTVLATPTTPQGSCDVARLVAWAKYVSCVDKVLAQDASCVVSGCPAGFDPFGFAAFAKCRHKYFKNWTAFQTKSSMATSTCQPSGGLRFVDNGDGTVTDNLTSLVWEKKDNLDGVSSPTDPHDADNAYTWGTYPGPAPNGTVFTSFLGSLNGGSGFAGDYSWRIPTLVELQSIVLDFTCAGAVKGPACSCGVSPCIDGTFGPTTPGLGWVWTQTSFEPLLGSPVLPGDDAQWLVNFGDGQMLWNLDIYGQEYWGVRAVRGGL